MGKLVRCKSCGAEIAKSANICPQCGAKQHQAVKAVCALILVFTIIGMIAILSGAFKDAQAQEDDASPSVSVSAKDLWKAYSDNKVNADNLYNGKILAVTGTITDIGKDMISGNPCVSLDSGSSYGLYPVQCFFTSNDKNSETLAALKDGQEITIYGECSGAPVFNVQMSDCYLPG